MEEKEGHKKEEQKTSTMSRRDFLKGAGILAGGAAAAGGLSYLLTGCEGLPGAPTGGEAPAVEPGTGPAGAPAAAGEIKTVYKGASFVGNGGGSPNAVDTRNGKIIRIRPFHYDEKYAPEQYKPWKIEARGKTFTPPSRTLPNKLSLCYKTRVYSPNRVLYPMKRVDWSPENRNPQTRGISKYKRISWDEATTLIADELNRQFDTYGPCSVMHMGDGHGESKTVHSIHGCPMRLLEIMGGYTKMVRNPDSWEGFWWGSKHVWGDGWMGLMAPQTNVPKDVFENTDMILFWGSDPETTYATFSDMLSSRECNFYTELGIKQVYVCPDLNYAASVHADKWIPVLPNTDPTFQLAIAYTWISEGTYDKGYVNTHTVGFDKFRAYVMGDDDGIPKTPEWASPLCGVSEWTIKALAREWARVATSTHHNCGGSYIRGPYSHEPARLESLLLSMQGIGKPGVHQISEQRGWVGYERRPSVAAAYRAGEFSAAKLPGQIIPKTSHYERDLESPNQLVQPRCIVQSSGGPVCEIHLSCRGKSRSPYDLDGFALLVGQLEQWKYLAKADQRRTN